jgi:hypothetical protein
LGVCLGRFPKQKGLNMGIQTTIHITRNEAIARINRIYNLAYENNYRGIEQTTFEPNHDIKEFVNECEVPPLYVHQWANQMLEDTMDRPFFRWSMFNNYIVED